MGNRLHSAVESDTVMVDLLLVCKLSSTSELLVKNKTHAGRRLCSGWSEAREWKSPYPGKHSRQEKTI